MRSRGTAERREYGRLRTHYQGWIHVQGGPGIPCRVLNVSSSGALIDVAAGTRLPAGFALTIEDANIASACEVRHRSGSRVGVAFPAALQALQVVSAAAARVPENVDRVS